MKRNIKQPINLDLNYYILIFGYMNTLKKKSNINK